MKSLSILAAILATGALCAQERPTELNARVILFGESTQTSAVELGQGVKDQAAAQTGAGIRFLGQVTDESRWFWELSGRFSSSANMVTNRDIGGGTILDATKVKIRYSYWSAGAGYLLPLGPSVDFGMHLEGRAETINPAGAYSQSSGGTGTIDTHTVYFRPWVRLSLDFKLKTGSFNTILGGDAGVATLKTTQRAGNLPQMDEQTMRAMAPTWSAALYAGFQF